MRGKLIDLIFYVVYVRLLLEAHETMTISSTVEIKQLQTSTTASFISQIISWLFLIFSLTLPTVALYLFYQNRKNFDPKKKFMLMEFFADVRNNKWARLYPSILLLRRLLFVVVIVFLPGEISRFIVYLVIIGIQLAYILLLVRV